MNSVRSYSGRHRVRSYFPSLIKPRMIEFLVTFAIPSKAVYSDTFASGMPYSYTYGSNTWTIHINQDSWIDTNQDIIGKIITHEVGNGMNDFLLNKCLLEVFPGSDWQTYDYSTTPDPKFEYELRPNVWIDQVNGDNVTDLVEVNMLVRGGLNPFTSVMQTPVDYSTTTSDKVPFNGDDTFGTFFGKPVESLVLLAPINTKFRRIVFTLTSVKCVVVRGIVLTMTEYTRRGFG